MLAYSLFNEVNNNLPYLCRIFDQLPPYNINTVSNLEIYAKSQLPWQHSKNIYRDKLIKKFPLEEGCRPIQKYIPRGPKTPSDTNVFGISLIRSYFYPDICYLIYTSRTSNVEQDFVIVLKNTLYKIIRGIYKANQLYNKKTLLKPPLLEKNLLDTVIENTVGFLKNKNFKKYGIKCNRGLVLYGKPGNGKTLLCNYLMQFAATHSIPSKQVSASTIEYAFNNNELIDTFNEEGNIIFFDDIDINYFCRKGSEAKKACSILSAMDGIENKSNTVRIFTTNEDVCSFDSAFYRPGRIDITLKLNPPNCNLRLQLIKERWHKDITENIDIEYLVDKSEGFSFAELDGVKNHLVIHYDKTEKWDLNKALNTIIENRNEKKSLKSGFAR